MCGSGLTVTVAARQPSTARSIYLGPERVPYLLAVTALAFLLWTLSSTSPTSWTHLAAFCGGTGLRRSSSNNPVLSPLLVIHAGSPLLGSGRKLVLPERIRSARLPTRSRYPRSKSRRRSRR